MRGIQRRFRVCVAHSLLLVAALCLEGLAGEVAKASAEPVHAIAMHGAPKYPPGFTHFPYVNAKAPKGGRLTMGVRGSFDSLNPLIVRGTSGAGVREFVYESLLERGRDEAFTLYGLLAESVEVPDDRSSISFNLNPKARFSDGKPVTVDDVLFSFEVLKEHGRPNHRTYYRKVIKTERIGDHGVKFVFDASGDREMPLILGLMPVLPRHVLTTESFQQTTLSAPIGSGPYIISKIDPGRSITYRRDPNYWARDLAVKRGRYNFDEIRYDYFRDANALFEAFKSGQIQARGETDPARWAEGYNIPPVKDGRVLRREFEIGLPAGMTALVFNTRREVFKDQRVRAALIRMFNFEWVNKSLFNGLFQRTASFFERSYLSSAGNRADQRERELLAPFAKSVRAEILEGTHKFPASTGTAHNRENWRAAMKLFGEAGYRLQNNRLIDKSGEPLTFEILAASSAQERLLASFASDLRKLGITASIRFVDSAQYQLRIKTYDYDMIQFSWRSSLSPGNEQLFRWSSGAAARDGTFNFAGVANPAVDAMISAMLQARTHEDFVSSVRALDRVLLSGDYVIPLFHLPKQWLAHWAEIKSPEKTPLFGYQLDTWWSEKARVN